MEIKFKLMFGLDQEQMGDIMYYMEHYYRMTDMLNIMEKVPEFQKLNDEEKLNTLDTMAERCDDLIADSGDWYEYALMAKQEWLDGNL